MPLINGSYGDMFLVNLTQHANSKISHDRYDVYVNGDFVGHKTLLTQTEDITDVNDFLHSQGYNRYEASLNGDHFEIRAEDETATDLAEALQIYLQTR
ncbi:hypothetical protein ACFSCX_00875 [Bacillus salitolerans]|uniref:Uncharacterized protein n=1 Tax=Bacillus salitolerans TaxID=1437434 RepID=A0ABW4LIP0_9BACI